MQIARVAAAALALAALASCARQERPAPAAAPTPAPRPPQVRPVLVPEPTPAPEDWRDAPLSPGEWSYSGEGTGATASFGPPGQPGFAIRCEGAGRIGIARRVSAASATALTLRTTSGVRTLPARSEGGALVASLAASDPFLDSIVFSRGRFTVEAAGLPPLILPAWPEPARVLEDCRP